MTEAPRMKTEAELRDEYIGRTAGVIRMYVFAMRRFDREKLMDIALEGFCRHCWDYRDDGVCYCTNDE